MSLTICGSTSSRSPDVNLPAPPAARRGAAVVGDLPSAPAPRGGLARGGCVSWNPEVFRPSTRKPSDHKPGYPATEGFNFSDDNFRIEPADVPGTGFVKPDCGQWIRKLKSEDQVKDIYHTCGTLGCPRCVDSTITEKAHEAAERFEHYEAAKLQENAVLVPGECRRAVPRHIAFTISPGHTVELWHRSGKNHTRFAKLARNEFNHSLRGSGIVGCVAVYHANRVRHPETGATGRRAKTLIIREAKLAGLMDDESPSHEMYAYIRKQKNWREYYYFSPHFHVIGFGKLLGHAEFESAFPGWSYHNKDEVPNVGGLLRYLFSHMAMIDGCHSVSWHGRLSVAVLGVDGLRTTDQPVICAETGLPWIIIESAIPDEIGRTYTESVTEYRAFFRTGRALRKGPPPFKAMKTDKRSSAPHMDRERCSRAEAAYRDDWGKL